MNRRLILFLEIGVALVALVMGYVFVVGKTAIDTSVAAPSVTTPDNPHILYLAPERAERGKVKDDVMKNRGAIPVRSWQEVRVAAESRTLDGLLVDATFFEGIDDSDKQWLRSQFRNGVVIAGFGIEDDRLAQILGLKTLRSPAEADIPLGPTGYRLVSSYVLGPPEDIKKLEDSDWINRDINEEISGLPEDIKSSMVFSFSKARGELNSNDDIDLLFLRLKSHIEDFYQTQQEMQQNSEEK